MQLDADDAMAVRIDRNEREAFLELAGKCTDNPEN